MSKNTKVSSNQVSSLAGRILSDPDASPLEKQLAGSALAQADPDKQTGAEMESLAAQVLQSQVASDWAKSLAGSVLSQSNSNR